jgi:eukaryotic-like serine/threonine-protein kinase
MHQAHHTGSADHVCSAAVGETERRLGRVEELFDRAVELQPGERAAFLDEACGDDAELRRELHELLASVDGAGQRLRGAVAAAADALAADERASHVGKRLGPYRLVEVIGEGGMGTVYLAERDDAQYKRRVAIKILQHGLASPAVVARFRDERQILAALEHPAIVRLLDGGSTEDNLPYLVMEYVEGVPLARFARQLSVRARVELVVRVCGALSYAHGKLVVHRDIKPSNILVTLDGAPKLLDFGIAKLLDPSAGTSREARTRTGMALLTPEYASPEQARGEPVSVGTDVYSLGAVLYDLLVGKPPQVPSDNVVDTLRSICDIDPPRPSVAAPPAIRRELTGDLDNIVMRALHKHASGRYPSIAAFADDLQRYLDGMPVVAREATFGYRARKFVRRHRGKLAIATAVAAALSTATVVSIIQAGRADEQARRAEAQTRMLLAEQGRRELENGHPGRALPYLVETLRRGDDTPATHFLIAEAARPFERQLARVTKLNDGLRSAHWIAGGTQIVAGGYNGRTRLYRSDGTLLRTFGDEDPVHAAQTIHADALTADGTRLVAQTSRGFALYDLVHRAEVTSVPADVEEAEGVAIDRTGARIAWYAPKRNAVVIADTATHTQRRIPAPVRTGFLFSPDATKLLTSGGDGSIAMWDVASGAERARWPTHGKPVDTFVFSHDTARIAASRGGITDVLDAATGAVIAQVEGGPFEFSPDDARLVTATPDRNAKIWDVRTGRLLVSLVGHTNLGIHDARFSPDGRRIVTTGADNTFRLWNATTGAVEEVIEATSPPSDTPHSGPGPMEARFSPDGSRLLTATATELFVWRTTREPLIHQYSTPDNPNAVRYSPDERTYVTANVDADVRDLATGELRTRLPRIDVGGQWWDVVWHPSGRELALVGDRGAAMIVSPAGAIMRRLAGHRGIVNHVAYSPDATRLATACDDHFARIFDPATGEEQLRLVHPHRVISVAWDPAGLRLATAGWDGMLRVWNAATGMPLQAMAGGATQFLDVAFSPDGTRLASAGHGGELAVWDVASGQRVTVFDGHTGPATTVAWSPDGALLASSGDDQRVLVWDVASGKLLATRMHPIGAMQVVWNRDGTHVLSANGPTEWDVHRDTRSLAELDQFIAGHIPWRLDAEGRLETRH